eukprot:3244292-Amphidinium_carterae.1
MALLLWNEEVIDDMLSQFGQAAYDANVSLHDYSETLNAVAEQRPILRHRLPRAWRLAKIWRSLVPIRNHKPVPLAVLRAMLTLAIAWKWYPYALIESCIGILWSASTPRGAQLES